MQRLSIHDLEGHLDQNTAILYQDGRPYTGRVYEDFQGRLDLEYDVVDGRKQGTETEYYPDGRAQAVSQYQHNVLHGRLTRYYESGAVEEQAQFEQGVCISSTTYDEAGQVLETYTIGEDSPDYAWLQHLRQQQAQSDLGAGVQ